MLLGASKQARYQMLQERYSTHIDNVKSIRACILRTSYTVQLLYTAQHDEVVFQPHLQSMLHINVCYTVSHFQFGGNELIQISN